jgi:uncharacterized protein YgbK (DUF1537 family)
VVSGGRSRLRAWIRKARSQARLLSFDCLQSGDVDRIARASLMEGGRHFVGASALGASLAQAVEGPAKSADPSVGLPWSILVGSVSETSFAQLRSLHGAGRAWASCIQRSGHRWRFDGPRRLVGRRAWALSSLAERRDLAPWLAQARKKGQSARVCAEEALTRLVRTGLARGGGLEQRAWFLTGGHSLAAFFGLAGLERFETLGQALPGIPLSRAEGPGGRAWIASKPGGFGSADALERFLELTEPA